MTKSLVTRSFFLSLLLIVGWAHAVEIDYYLPDAAQYDNEIATPQSILGYQVGEWHARPEQVERYFMTLAQQSPRVKIKVIGYTHEKRPLIHAYISSPENLAKLETIRQQHLSGEQPAKTPLVTWMGYSVHGNEASGSNSSLLLAYHLAAAQDDKTLAQLRDQVIIIDPMLNPDGLARFAHWVNMYQSLTPSTDSNHIEHHEGWPYGRTNHYWFDLNRDWLLLQHPESKARVTQFQLWRPHILTDFHEMGTNSTYFFQPGVHSRQNPLTPEANFKMTATIAEYHAKALDDIGSLYYSKENFDDFYYGKGSTYPDVHGTVGILFEQGSARGHLQATRYGELSFPFAIRNHLTTSLSTIEAAQNNQAGLKAMQRQFHLETEQLAKDDRLRAVVLGSHDPYRLDQLATILRFHQIEFYPLAKSVTVKSQRFTPGQSIIVPLRQSQYRLIKAMFETRTQFKDKVFYDVSAWNLAMAMDLNYAFISRSDFSHDLFAKKTTPSQPAAISEQALALAFDWNDFNSARLLSEMQQFGLRVQTVTKPTQLTTQSGVTELSLGSLILPLNNQPEARAEIIKWLTPKLSQLAIPPKEIHSGLAINGVDMGSPSIPVLKPVKPLLLIGDDFSSYATGEIWHLLDQRLKQPVTMMTAKQVAKLGSLDYTHLILAGGKPKLEDELVEKIAAWVKQGGVIIAHSGSAKWLLEQGWTSSEVKAFDKPIDTQIAYSEKDQTDAEHHIGGAIVGATIDTSHPLGFGLDNTYLPVFKRDRTVFTEAKEAFVSIARFHDKPLASGYVSKANQSHIAGETSILVQRMGKGRLVAFSDNPVFRGYWLGTAKVFTNALYFSPIVEAPEKTKPDNKEKDKTDSQESS